MSDTLSLMHDIGEVRDAILREAETHPEGSHEWHILYAAASQLSTSHSLVYLAGDLKREKR